MRERIYQAIDTERERQEALCAAKKFHYTCASQDLSIVDKLAVLAEEFGEVAADVVQLSRLSSDRIASVATLRRELVQVAAVTVAWLESLE